jgi:glutamate formiminotransferase/formiminotetrahydrofolate cyclodeaminase
MITTIVECVANFSEARRPQVVESVMEAITSVGGVALLDRHSDLDHNRTVLTFAGPPDEIEEAAFRAIAKAAELINLDVHVGEHPRIGATDVVPFVPIAGVSMDECVKIARRLGQRVGDKLEIPVYLYEEAATRPERGNLENIRRGQYEALKEEIGTNPERDPDFGPKRVGPAGATVIGARHPLIAYNVYLTSDDVSIAKKIAKAIRHSSGGLRYVKALGMLVEGQAQVSMNLTNFHRTPLARVVEMIRRESVRYGVNVHHGELVGLIPQEALVNTANWYLQLDQFERDQILEYRLADAFKKTAEVASGPQSDLRSLDMGFLDALAEGKPTPGGGSAAAYSGAAGAALVAMVARLTIGKKKYATVEAHMIDILDRIEQLREGLTEAVVRDADAFSSIMAAYRMPKDTTDQKSARAEAIQKATQIAASVPLEVAGMAMEVLELAADVVAEGNLNAISDGATGAEMAKAAITGAGYNVRINTASLKDEGVVKLLLTEMEELEQGALSIETKIRGALITRGGLRFT